jgi:hypothetical protein
MVDIRSDCASGSRSFIKCPTLSSCPCPQMQLQADAEYMVAACKNEIIDVPIELVPLLETFPVANASWKAWLVGELPEVSFAND